MKIFEKILLGFLILVFIGSLLIPVFIGSFSFYSFLDALTNTLLWGIPCLFIWVIVKIFIYFTKKKEKTKDIEKIEEVKKIEETKKVKKTRNISKKIITLLFILLITINTIFWLYFTTKTLVGSEYYLEEEMGKKGYSLRGGIDWIRVMKETPKRTDEEHTAIKTIEVVLIEHTITYRMIKTFEGKETILIAFLIITDVLLIAIYFMIIPLYKERTIGDKK